MVNKTEKTIKTTQQIIEQAFVKDRIFGISIGDRDRIHFYEHDKMRNKKWISIYSLKKKAKEMTQIFPYEASVISEFIKNL